jgi:hypothetical protein
VLVSSGKRGSIAAAFVPVQRSHRCKDVKIGEIVPDGLEQRIGYETPPAGKYVGGIDSWERIIIFI